MGLLLPKLLRKVGLAQQLILFPTFNHVTIICKNLSWFPQEDFFFSFYFGHLIAAILTSYTFM